MPDGNAPNRINKDVDPKIRFNSSIKNDDQTVLKIRDAFRNTLENKGPGVEEYARSQNGASVTINLDFHSREFRDDVAKELIKADLGRTFMFVSDHKNRIDFQIDGNLSEVLNDVSIVLQASGSDVYIHPVGGADNIKRIAEDDVMSAFSLWLSGRMSGQIAPDMV